jgi:outer membrane protein TolC
MKSSLTSVPSANTLNIVCICALILGGLFAPNHSFAQNTSPQSSPSKAVLTPDYVLELALSSPVFLNESTARLKLAEGELESARRWWMPVTTFGATRFSHTGNALNANGEIFSDVDARSAELGFGLYFNADAGRGFTGVETARISQKATIQQVKAERDAFVLSCMNLFISAVSATKEHSDFLTASNELSEIEKQFETLAGLGLRPYSDALMIQAERLYLESQTLLFQSTLERVLAELRGALGLPGTVGIQTVWPSLEETLGVSVETNSLSGAFLLANPPARQAIHYRIEEAESEKNGLSREVWLPELRFSPMLSGFGSDFASTSLASTTEWVASAVFSFPLENIFPGGQRQQAEAKVDLANAKLAEWDLRHSAYVDGLTLRISTIQKRLEAAISSSLAADSAMSDVLLRSSHGIVDPVELLQIHSRRLQAHSYSISLKEMLLKLQFELISETNPSWTK